MRMFYCRIAVYFKPQIIVQIEFLFSGQPSSQNSFLKQTCKKKNWKHIDQLSASQLKVLLWVFRVETVLHDPRSLHKNYTNSICVLSSSASTKDDK